MTYYCKYKPLALALKGSQILLPLAGLLALGLLLLKKAAGSLNYFIRGVAIAFEGITPVLRLDIVVQNPSNQTFVVRSITGDVSVDSSVVGNASMFQTVTIAGNAQAVLPVQVRLSPLAIVSDLVSIITKGSGIPKTIVFKGYVNANEVVNDIDLTYKIS